jgi:hypothetical protein
MKRTVFPMVILAAGSVVCLRMTPAAAFEGSHAGVSTKSSAQPVTADARSHTATQPDAHAQSDPHARSDAHSDAADAAPRPGPHSESAATSRS